MHCEQAMATASVQLFRQNDGRNDVTVAATRSHDNASRDLVPRDLVTELPELGNDILRLLLHDSFYAASELLHGDNAPPNAADDSGISLSGGIPHAQYLTEEDEWNSWGTCGRYPVYDDVMGEQATGKTPKTSVEYFRNAAIGKPEVEIQAAVAGWPDPFFWSTGISAANPHDDVIRSSSCARASAGSASIGFASASPACSGSAPDGCSSIGFTDEQIVCICVALQQKSDIDRLEQFLATLSASRHSYLLWPDLTRDTVHIIIIIVIIIRRIIR